MALIATLYSNSNFSGNSISITTSISSIADLALWSFNNIASSVVTYNDTSNFEINLYDGANFTGSSLKIRYPLSISNLSDYGFNDKVSSISTNNGGSSYAIACRDKNSGGLKVYFPQGSYDNLGNTPLGNDKLSSLIVPSPILVTLCRDSNFAGPREYIQNNTGDQQIINVANNDWASSMIVGPGA